MSLLLSKPAGRAGIAMSATMFLGAVIVFQFSSWFPIKRKDFWAVMPACLVFAVSIASVPFMFLLAALPSIFQPNDGQLVLIGIFSFLFIGAFSVLPP